MGDITVKDNENDVTGRTVFDIIYLALKNKIFMSFLIILVVIILGLLLSGKLYFKYSNDKGLDVGLVPTGESPETENKDLTSDRFIKDNNGIIYDNKERLGWVAAPDVNMNWNDANDWANNHELDGGDWSLPTEKQLSSILESCKIKTTLLSTTGSWLWCKKRMGNKAWGLHLDYCKYAWRGITDNRHKRAFAVRSRKTD